MNDTADSLKQQLSNFPNRVSLARLVLAIFVFILIPLKMYWAAFIFFVLAAGTDWLDGWYARKYNMVTKLGRVLDPFCDKILICGSYILLAVEMNGLFPWYAQIAGWMAVVVSGRELLVTVLRSMIEASGGDFSAKMPGKIKMWFQCITVGACLVALATRTGDGVIAPWLFWLVVVSVWISIASTLHSGWLYIVGSAKYIATPCSEVDQNEFDFRINPRRALRQ